MEGGEIIQHYASHFTHHLRSLYELPTPAKTEV